MGQLGDLYLPFQYRPEGDLEFPRRRLDPHGATPTDFALTFSDPIDPGSVVASDFSVNGVPADSASVSGDDLTVTYTFNSTPVSHQGNETMSLPGGSVRTAGGDGNAPFSAGFLYVAVQLAVSATSPAVGSILAAPVTDLVVQFNKDFDPYTVSASDFQISGQGTIVSVVPLTSSTVDVTLAGINQDGTFTLSLPAGAINDVYGIGNVPFTGTYIVDIGSAPYPTPLAAKPPLGSLIYDPSIAGAISYAGDTDTFTLPVAANQTITLVLSVDPGNFVAPTSGTYYVDVTGDPGVEYSLTATGGVNFDIERNDTIYTAQSLDGTNGVLGSLKAGGSLTVGSNFDGTDFFGSNCGCLPPDTNAAVGPAYVVETVNVQIRTLDKTTGSIVADQSLASFIGASSGGDPYVVYDDIANRWYVTAFDSSDAGLFLKVSNDSNPLDGWGPTLHLDDVGGFPDYPNMIFNYDVIFINYNDFGSGGSGDDRRDQ